MSTQKNKNFLVGIVGLIFLSMVAFTLMSTEDESVENQIEIEEYLNYEDRVTVQSSILKVYGDFSEIS